MMLTYETKEDVELVGFFDLLLAQTPRHTYLDFLESFLCKTVRDELYQYVIALLVAHSHPEVRTMLLTVARQEQSAHRIEILLSACKFSYILGISSSINKLIALPYFKNIGPVLSHILG